MSVERATTPKTLPPEYLTDEEEYDYVICEGNTRAQAIARGERQFEEPVGIARVWMRPAGEGDPEQYEWVECPPGRGGARYWKLWAEADMGGGTDER